HDGGIIDASIVQICDHLCGNALLFWRVIEDRGAVLRADVCALPVECGRVVDGEEDFEQFFVGDDLRVVSDLDGFGVAGRARADLLVAWARDVPARIAGDDTLDAAQLAIDSRQTPEAAARYCRSLKPLVC